MKTIRLSVIIPFVGKEWDFEKRLLSLMEQSLADSVEWVFVSGPQGKESVERLKEHLVDFPDIVKQVRLIELTKSGEDISNVLREGYLNSAGEYIAYGEPGINVEREMFKTMLSRAEETGADIVVYEGSAANEVDMVVSGMDPAPLCNKLFSRKLYLMNGAGSGEPVAQAPDYVIASQLMMTAEKIEVIKEVMPLQNERITAEAIEAVEGYMRRNNLYAKFENSLSKAKMRLKDRLMMNCDRKQLKEYMGMYMDVQPSVMENSEMRIMNRLALANARMGDSLLYRILRLTRKHR